MPPGPRSLPAAADASPRLSRDAWTPQFHPGWTSLLHVSNNPTTRPSLPVDGACRSIRIATRRPGLLYQVDRPGRRAAAWGDPASDASCRGGRDPREDAGCAGVGLAGTPSFRQDGFSGRCRQGIAVATGEPIGAAHRTAPSILSVRSRWKAASRSGCHEPGRGDRGVWRPGVIPSVRLRRIGLSSRRLPAGGRPWPDSWA